MEVKNGTSSNEILWLLVCMDEVKKQVLKIHPELKDYEKHVGYNSCAYEVNSKKMTNLKD